MTEKIILVSSTIKTYNFICKSSVFLDLFKLNGPNGIKYITHYMQSFMNVKKFEVYFYFYGMHQIFFQISN